MLFQHVSQHVFQIFHGCFNSASSCQYVFQQLCQQVFQNVDRFKMCFRILTKHVLFSSVLKLCLKRISNMCCFKYVSDVLSTCVFNMSVFSTLCGFNMCVFNSCVSHGFVSACAFSICQFSTCLFLTCLISTRVFSACVCFQHVCVCVCVCVCAILLVSACAIWCDSQCKVGLCWCII